ncbi:unnamed protein product [Camellia sinensis]
MSSMENNPLPPIPGRVVIAYDATKNRNEGELKRTVDSIRSRGDILHGGDTLTLLGVLHKVPHPMGYQMQASPVSFLGTNMSVLKDEVSKKIDMYVNMLLQSAEECKNEKVDIEVMVTAGTPIQKVVLQEVTTCNATWVVLDRRDLSFYLKQISSKVALIRDNLSVEVLRPHTTIDTGNVEHRVVYSISKLVPLSAVQDNENNEQSVIFCRSCSASMTSLKSSNRSFMENNPLIPGRVVIAYDATKDRKERELKLTVDNLRLRGDILHGGDTLMLLGVLHRLPHPMGYQMQASPVSLMGTNMIVMKNEVSKKIDMYVDMLLQSAEECKDEKVDIEVMVTAGTPIQKVVLQEVTTCNATWVVLDRGTTLCTMPKVRHLRRDLRFYLKQISSKMALIHDNLSVEVFRSYTTTRTDNVERRVVYSISKPVPLSAVQDNENNEQSVISCRSCSASMTSSKSSAILENNLTSSFTHRSREHHFSSGNLGSTSKQEKSEC